MNSKTLSKYICISLTSVIFFLTTPIRTFAAELYPDLLTIPPTDLQFAEETINGQQKTVLRFTNTVWNAGYGPLEMYGTTTQEGQTQVQQRIYHEDGNQTESTAGNFVWHPAHNHWHFEKFAKYELWSRNDYESWLASDRTSTAAPLTGYKTTFCIRETQMIRNYPDTPQSPIHTECGDKVQGLSVGWGDSYRYDIPEQWIEVGDAPLPDGQYVLRSVVDPDNVLKESPDNDPYYESSQDNEAVTNFEVYQQAIYTE